MWCADLSWDNEEALIAYDLAKRAWIKHIVYHRGRNRGGLEPELTRVLFIGQAPETVDFSDPSLPPGFNAQKIQAGIDLAAAKIAERGWSGDLCMISPDAAGIAMLEKQLASATYECVVIGGGMRIPPKGLVLFEQVVNAVHKADPRAAIAFNTHPEDTADAAARWITAD